MLPSTFVLRRDETLSEGGIIDFIKKSLTEKYGNKVYIHSIQPTRPSKNNHKGENDEKKEKIQ